MENEYIEKIHRFLNGGMTEQESAQFEVEMNADPELRQAVNLEKKVLLSIELKGDKDLRNQILETGNKLRQEGFFDREQNNDQPFSIHSAKQSFSMKRVLAIAAALALILGAVWYHYSRKTGLTPDEAFAKYYKVNHDQVRDQLARLPQGMAGALGNEQDSLKAGLTYFEEGKYAECIKILAPLVKTHTDNLVAQYYLGLAHLNESRYAKAIELLDPLAKNKAFQMHYDAMWYVGLCYLKVEDGLSAAINVFQQLSLDFDYPGHREALSMYNMLSSDRK